jgi:murein DD-endopeptidase MepM/ murein hydrolase activator NlpD
MEKTRIKQVSKVFAALLAALCALLFAVPAGASVKVNLADGFDFPVGKPDAKGYYKARGLRLRSPQHFGEDWNGRGGGNTDLGDPVYTVADGVVTFAHNVRQGWGNVVLIRHAYRDPTSGQVKFIDSLYGHLDKIMVKTGQGVKRGQQVGTIGTNFGMYPAHLHFEMRHNIHIGMGRRGVPSDLANWADPTQFINKYRRLNREWRGVAVPTGTYQEYAGFKGL